MKLTTEYKEEFAAIAFQKLSSVPLRDECILCLVFKCSKQTLSLWKSEHEDFRDAIELGLLSGEYKFRELLFTLALVPPKKVNTKLLSILASNVYNITEEQVQQISATIKDGDLSTIEKQLEALGIPVPEISIEDIPEEI